MIDSFLSIRLSIVSLVTLFRFLFLEPDLMSRAFFSLVMLTESLLLLELELCFLLPLLILVLGLSTLRTELDRCLGPFFLLPQELYGVFKIRLSFEIIIGFFFFFPLVIFCFETGITTLGCQFENLVAERLSPVFWNPPRV